LTSSNQQTTKNHNTNQPFIIYLPKIKSKKQHTKNSKTKKAVAAIQDKIGFLLINKSVIKVDHILFI